MAEPTETGGEAGQPRIVRSADFAELRPTDMGPQPSLDTLFGVKFEVEAVLGRVVLPIEEILKLGTGAIVELDRSISDPVDLATKQRIMQEVPKATVVVTNPTHLAIALRYDRDEMDAPLVVAKGRGFIAEQIVDLARRHNVPVVQRIPVAQALYKSVKIGQEIPSAMYVAVSEVIAYVFQLRGQKA